MNGTIALSNEDYLSSAFEAIRRNISEEIRREPKHQILNVNEAQYIEHVLSKPGCLYRKLPSPEYRWKPRRLRTLQGRFERASNSFWPERIKEEFQRTLKENLTSGQS
jgi:hypothetical protein